MRHILFISLLCFFYAVFPAQAQEIYINSFSTFGDGVGSEDFRTGLVAEWTMDDAHVSGATLSDQSGNANDGEIIGTVSTTGQVNEGRLFDGNDRINISEDASTLTLTTAFTVMGWIYWDGTGSGAIYSGGSANEHYWVILLNEDYGASPGDTDKITLGLDGGTGSQGASDVPTDQWVHFAVVRSGTSVTFYLDGCDDGTQTIAVWNASGTKIIGDRGESERWIEASIDELRVYSTALSEAQVQQVFQYHGGTLSCP